MLAKFCESLIHYFNQLSPYFIFGLFISGILKVILKDSWIKSQLSKASFSSIFKATAIGLPLPLCSCSVIPMSLTIRKMGASRSAMSSFLVSTPETGVDSILMTLSFFSPPYAIVRVITAFLSAMLAGVLQFFFNEEEYKGEQEVKSCCAKSGDKKTFKDGMRYAFIDLMDDMAFNLVIGILLGALITTLVPSNLGLLTDPHLSKFLIVLIAIPFYICATASTPIAAALVGQGLSLGGALIFLSLGPVTNITNLLIVKKELGLKGVLLNIFAVSFVAIILSYYVDYYISDGLLSADTSTHEHFSYINYICSFILLFLITNSLIIRKLRK